MKAPAFLGTALKALRKAGKGALRGVLTGLRRLASAMDRKTRLLVMAIAAGALLLVAAIVIGATVAGTAGAPAAPFQATAATALPGGGAMAIPRSGPGLASMLLIPGSDDWPWPLALEPKARYTEADAAEVRPDLGEIDVTDLSARRKAELETIFSAVD
ncbi:MAG: hypothetical protein CVV47_15275 [Spirochaetae bacterium HGW-Spirochaetae-3]|nr:MAG: hypothetical protein CVV47_15275 [Spirochaetae bacterium HGW-Spirochaetae-3]